jgi:hypothetical protein
MMKIWMMNTARIDRYCISFSPSYFVNKHTHIIMANDLLSNLSSFQRRRWNTLLVFEQYGSRTNAEQAEQNLLVYAKNPDKRAYLEKLLNEDIDGTSDWGNWLADFTSFFGDNILNKLLKGTATSFQKWGSDEVATFVTLFLSVAYSKDTLTHPGSEDFLPEVEKLKIVFKTGPLKAYFENKDPQIIFHWLVVDIGRFISMFYPDYSTDANEAYSPADDNPISNFIIPYDPNAAWKMDVEAGGAYSQDVSNVNQQQQTSNALALVNQQQQDFNALMQQLQQQLAFEQQEKSRIAQELQDEKNVHTQTAQQLNAASARINEVSNSAIVGFDKGNAELTQLKQKIAEMDDALRKEKEKSEDTKRRLNQQLDELVAASQSNQMALIQVESNANSKDTQYKRELQQRQNEIEKQKEELEALQQKERDYNRSLVVAQGKVDQDALILLEAKTRHNSYVAELKKQHDQAMNEVARKYQETSSKLSLIDQEMQQLNAKYIAEKNRSEGLSAELKTAVGYKSKLQQDLQSLQNQSGNKNAAYKQIQDELQAVNNDIAAMTQQLKNERESSAAVKREFEELKLNYIAEIDSLRKSHQDIMKTTKEGHDKTIAELKKQQQDDMKLIQSQKQKISELENLLSKGASDDQIWKHRYDAAEKHIKELEAQIAKYKGEFDSLQRKLDQTIDSHKGSNSLLDAKIAQYENQLRLKDARIVDLDQRLKAASIPQFDGLHDIDSDSEEPPVSLNQIRVVDAEIAALKLKIAKHKDLLLNAIRTQNQKAVATTAEKLKDLQQKLKAKEEERDKLQLQSISTQKNVPKGKPENVMRQEREKSELDNLGLVSIKNKIPTSNPLRDLFYQDPRTKEIFVRDPETREIFNYDDYLFDDDNATLSEATLRILQPDNWDNSENEDTDMDVDDTGYDTEEIDDELKGRVAEQQLQSENALPPIPIPGMENEPYEERKRYWLKKLGPTGLQRMLTLNKARALEKKVRFQEQQEKQQRLQDRNLTPEQRTQKWLAGRPERKEEVRLPELPPIPIPGMEDADDAERERYWKRKLGNRAPKRKKGESEDLAWRRYVKRSLTRKGTHWTPSSPFDKIPHSGDPNHLHINAKQMTYGGARTLAGYRGKDLKLPQRQKKNVYVDAYQALPRSEKLAIKDPNLMTIPQLKQLIGIKGGVNLDNWAEGFEKEPKKADYVQLFKETFPDATVDVNWRKVDRNMEENARSVGPLDYDEEHGHKFSVDSSGMPLPKLRRLVGPKGMKLSTNYKKPHYVSKYKDQPKRVSITDPDMLSVVQLKQLLDKEGVHYPDRVKKAQLVSLFKRSFPNERIDVNNRTVGQYARSGEGSYNLTKDSYMALNDWIRNHDAEEEIPEHLFLPNYPHQNDNAMSVTPYLNYEQHPLSTRNKRGTGNGFEPENAMKKRKTNV